MKNTLLTICIFCLTSISLPLSAQEWKWGVGSTCPGGVLEAAPVAVDKDGNVYEAMYALHGYVVTDSLVSTFGAFSTLDSDNESQQGILVCTDSNGHYRWMLSTQQGKVQFISLATDPFGDVYVTGATFSSSHHFTFGNVPYTGGGTFMAKVSAAGNVLWIKSLMGGYGAGSVDGIRVNSTGCVYAAGQFAGATFTLGTTTLTNTDGTGGTTDVFYAKYDSSGNPLWAKNFGGTGSDYPVDIAITNDTELYIGGYYRSASITIGTETITPAGSLPFFLAKFNASGDPVWARTVYSNTYGMMLSLTTDASNSVYIAGSYYGFFTTGPDTLRAALGSFLAKYDSAGNGQWAKTIPGLITGFSTVADVCGNIWLACSSNGSGPDPMYLAEYDAAGHLNDTVRLSSGGDDGSNLALDNKGNLYLGGDYFIPSFILGTDTLTIPDSAVELSFIAKYHYLTDGCVALGTSQEPQPQANEITLFPNPATYECTIHSTQGFSVGAQVDIYDITGRQVLRQPLVGTDTIIPLGKLPKGVYECRIFNNGYRVETKKLAVD